MECYCCHRKAKFQFYNMHINMLLTHFMVFLPFIQMSCDIPRYAEDDGTFSSYGHRALPSARVCVRMVMPPNDFADRGRCLHLLHLPKSHITIFSHNWQWKQFIQTMHSTFLIPKSRKETIVFASANVASLC